MATCDEIPEYFDPDQTNFGELPVLNFEALASERISKAFNRRFPPASREKFGHLEVLEWMKPYGSTMKFRIPGRTSSYDLTVKHLGCDPIVIGVSDIKVTISSEKGTFSNTYKNFEDARAAYSSGTVKWLIGFTMWACGLMNSV